MEGLWFFLIPDLIVSYYATKGIKSALISVCSVVLGAMFAACLLYFYLLQGGAAASQLEHFWSYLPGYYPKMLELASQHLKESEAMGLLQGPNSGIPYRFYVLKAFFLNIPLFKILLWTPFARLERILLAPFIVSIMRFLALKFLPKRWSYFNEKRIEAFLLVTIILYWVAIYYWYWGSFLPKTYVNAAN
jgi:hypothetical protein